MIRNIKKSIPKYPNKIAVLTSPTGAAIRDIISTIERRYSIVEILIIPVLVQGKQAINSIVDGISKANQMKSIDLIILGRGGGSLEELWSFNEEAVARAIFKSEIPIISAVGHETDITISDMVSDLRAPTPTAAAELAVPSKIELLETIQKLDKFLSNRLLYRMERAREKLISLENSYVFKYPERLVEEKEQRFDGGVLDKLSKQMQYIITTKKEQYSFLHQHFHHFNPMNQIEKNEEEIYQLMKRLGRANIQQMNNKRKEFTKMLSQLDLLNPTRIMSRGYSITYQENKSILKSVKDTKIDSSIIVRLSDGSLECTIDQIREEDPNE